MRPRRVLYEIVVLNAHLRVLSVLNALEVQFRRFQMLLGGSAVVSLSEELVRVPRYVVSLYTSGERDSADAPSLRYDPHLG